jgi:hypothetical protein
MTQNRRNDPHYRHDVVGAVFGTSRYFIYMPYFDLFLFNKLYVMRKMAAKAYRKSHIDLRTYLLEIQPIFKTLSCPYFS